VDEEKEIRENPGDLRVLRVVKKMGFSDRAVARLWGTNELEVWNTRRKFGIAPVYKMIDTCASEFESYVPYFYLTYEDENETVVSDKRKILVLGSGPIRIGQGVEFDYSTVHAVQTIKAAG
jgi:carbamoyl-phosphate synthase large subunit